MTGHRLTRQSLLVGLGAVVLTMVGGVWNPAEFFRAWLIAEIFWLGLALGSLAWAMIHYLTGGRWGNPLRRIFESAMGTVPFLAVTFIPLFFGLRFLYPWAATGESPADHVMQHRHIYMNGWAFLIRAVIIFGVWTALSWRLNALSTEQDRTTSPEPTRKLRTLSGPGLVIYPLTGTFAFVDWIMSTESTWFSSMFPILICMGQMLAALAGAIVVLFFLRRGTVLEEASGPETFHHLGSLLLAVTMMWAYLAFSQLLIIWSGDLPHEISWYLHRIAGAWKYAAIFLFAFHFAIPFILLLSRNNKRRVRVLVVVAAIVLVAHIIEAWWLMMPSFHPQGVWVHWMDFGAFIGIGGIWLGLFARNLSGRPLLPVNDPRFAVARVPV